ncbi:MAG TPA: ABC transporter ATP-binding protein [Chloroflexi bacterium]|jgi:ABC-2 type transport system ATP-binding protein|nr:ABC transporter ATP-binding protein [Chloroflexota bacterium]
MSTIIEIEDLTKIYTPRRRGVRPIVAVDHVSFDVQAGQTFGFLGPNGAGKTTTIRMCTGIIRPTSGRIVVAGSGMVADPIRVKERIGVVSDATSLYNEMSAWENLRFFAGLYGIPPKKWTMQAERLLRLFGLYDRRHSRIATFSTGMKKYLAIAVALVHEPQVLFLDEPTTGLDVQSARQLREMIRELNGHGVTVFLTTHYIEEADYLCHQIAIINEGKIVASGTPAELKEMAQGDQIIEIIFDHEADSVAHALSEQGVINRVVVTGNRLRLQVGDPSAAFTLLFNTIDRGRFRALSVNTVKPSLEDAFVLVTGLHSDVMKNGK